LIVEPENIYLTMIKKKYAHISICFLILFVLILKTTGQSPHFKSIEVYKSKKNYQVNVTYQDNKGFIWFGTSEGLARYDGVDFLYFTEEDSMAGNDVTAISQDKEGQIWTGHRNGKISILKNDIPRAFKPEAGLGTVEITDIFIDKENIIWFSTLGEGVYYWDGRRLKNLSTFEGLSDDYVYAIAKDSMGNMWFGTDNGLSVYNLSNKKFSKISMTDGLPDNIVKHLSFSSDSSLWIGMEDAGLCMYNTYSASFFIPGNWRFGTVNNFVVRRNNEIWVSTKRKGIVELEWKPGGDIIYNQFTDNLGLLSNKTYHVHIDCEYNIWIGSQNGVSLFTGDVFEFLDKSRGFPVENVFDVLVDSQDRIWASSPEQLVIYQKNSGGGHLLMQVKELFPELTTAYFNSLYEDHKGFVWAGTYGSGIIRISPELKKFDSFSIDDGLANNSIIYIAGKDSSLYISTLGGGVSIGQINYQEVSFKNYTTDSGLTNNYVYSTFMDSKNRLWIAEDGENISVLENGIIRNFGPEDGLESVIYTFIETPDQDIWMSSSEGGIFHFDGEEFHQLSIDQGLQTNLISSLATSAGGEIIIISNEGIEEFNTRDSTLHHYGDEYGVAYLEPNINALFEDKDGAVWIGTQSGIIKYNPKNKPVDTLRPKIFIDNIRLFYKDLEQGKQVFRYNENHLIFEYTGLWFKEPEKLLYRYKLEGYDLNWSLGSKLRSVTYSNIQPGKYTFRVQASNRPGKWIESDQSSFRFTIKPPFWQTWWFILICIIALASGIFFFIRYRLAKLRRDKELLELEVQKRTRKISEQKEEIEQQKNQIEDKNVNITNSIQYASRIQNALLTPLRIIDKLFDDYFIFYRPRDIVSGDFYWVKETNRLIFIVASDCTGHGVPGAFMSMLGISFLNEIVNKGSSQANQILNELREHIMTSLRQTGQEGETRDGMDMAICIIDKQNNKLQYAGANNPFYMIRDGEFMQVKADRMPVGIYYKSLEEFTNHEFDIRSGDCIYIFSDGYIDQTGGAKSRKFLSKNFRNLLFEIHQEPMKEQLKILDETMNNWMKDEEQVDDMLVMGIRF
jgi:ligand-binding sensor domain-containing protein/serine phosphatase RsbU (regulator of sigma subunit)